MKISIDMDGTMLKWPEFFTEFVIAMQARGHQVGVLTSRDNSDGKDRTESLMDRGIPKLDFYIGRNAQEQIEQIHQVPWKKNKMKELGIDFHFDDWGEFSIIELFSHHVDQHPRIGNSR